MLLKLVFIKSELTIKLCHSNSLVQDKSVRSSLVNDSADNCMPNMKSMSCGYFPVCMNLQKFNMSAINWNVSNLFTIFWILVFEVKL